MVLPQEIYDIANAIKDTVPVEKIYLYGSYAYGVPTKNSDYDFYLVLPDNSKRPLLAVQDAHGARPKNNTTPIDIIGDYSSNFYRRKDSFRLEKKIFNEGVVLYEGA